MLADEVQFVIGVDTHRDAHTLAVVTAATGGLCHHHEVPASGPGFQDALACADRHAPGPRAWAIEGTGAYGRGLARFLDERGERVIEVDRPQRSGERRRDKSDALDALRAARSALAREHALVPRMASGAREALRVLMVARDGAVHSRAHGLRQLRALVVSAPEPIRDRLRGLTKVALLKRASRLRARPDQDPATRATVLALVTLARRVREVSAEARMLEREIAAQLQAAAPELLAQPGVGPITGAQVLISWSHPGRVRSEAAFARLAGAAPIPASSGLVVRHRLDRGGDRRLNRALHTILVIRRAHDPATRDYMARRVSEGKSEREAMRCLKRYLARSLYRLLEASSGALLAP